MARRRILAATGSLAWAVSVVGAAEPAMAAQHQNAYYYSHWNFAGSSTGYWNVDQDVSIATKARATYWAQLWSWTGSSEGGYLGLQTNGSRFNGTSGDTAIFSLWNANGSRSANCGSFAGEGTGKSCRVAYPFKTGRLYRLRPDGRVEVLLDGNDMPLIQAREVDAQGTVLKPGSPARVQFEGWPALQVIGWPSIAVGTFGGEVVVVDPTDNGKGKFRALIAPKPDLVSRSSGKTQVRHWPDERWLRQGVRANGWVLLQQVPLWYELWRQMNGFPPVLTEEQIGGKK